MSAQVDLGTEVVNEISKNREFQDNEIRGRERGFVWVPLGVTQEVWSDDPVYDWGTVAWRVHVRTHVLRGFADTAVHLRALSPQMSRSPLSAFVRNPEDPTRLQLASSFLVTATNRAWAPTLIGLIAREQLAVARDLRHVPALVASGIVADRLESRSAANGFSGPNVFDPIDAGTFSDADPAGVVDITRTLAVLHHVWQLHAVRTPKGIIATAPCPADLSALIEIEAKAHSRLGLGLSVKLTVPGRADVSDALAFAEAELEAGCRTDALGCWFVTHGVLMHHSFVPVLIAMKDQAEHVVRAAARRTLWLRAGPAVPSREGLVDQPPIRRLLKFLPHSTPAPDDNSD